MKGSNKDIWMRASLIAVLCILSLAPVSSADVSPGDVVDKTNWEKAQGLLPEPILNWVKKGDITLNIDELTVDPRLMFPQATMKAFQENVGRFDISSDGGIIDKQTGKPAIYFVGYPFPEIDMSDPKAAEKIMYNRNYAAYQMGNYVVRSRFYWVGRSTGFEREVELISYSAPLTGNPSPKEVPNPEEIEKYQIALVKKPFDLSGTAIMTHRFIASNKSDNTFGYIPAIRRVRRMSTAERSDTFIGSDICSDDLGGYDGKVTDFEFKLVRKEERLLPYIEKGAYLTVKNERGEWVSTSDVKQVIYGFQKEGWKGAPWVPTNIIWVKRFMYLLEMKPKDPFYNYGIQYLWVDDTNFGANYKVINDRTGKYWKMIIVVNAYCQSADKTMAFPLTPCILAVDDRADHATIAVTMDPRDIWRYFAVLDLNDFSLAGFQKFCK